MIKHVSGWELPRKLEECNVYVKHFSEAQVRCLKDYVNSLLREKPGHFILDVGTNSLDSNRSLNLIAKKKWKKKSIFNGSLENYQNATSE